MRFCPYAQRGHLTLNAKNIPYHTININLTDKPEWYQEVSPLGKVPSLELVNEPGTPSLIESMVIMEYLDEKYPQKPLFPKDPLAKAQDKIWIERFNQVTAAFYRIATKPQEADQALKDLSVALDLFENELKRRGTPLFGGEASNVLDYAIWPWFERTELVKKWVGEDKFQFDKSRYPTLVSC